MLPMLPMLPVLPVSPVTPVPPEGGSRDGAGGVAVGEGVGAVLGEVVSTEGGGGGGDARSHATSIVHKTKTLPTISWVPDRKDCDCIVVSLTVAFLLSSCCWRALLRARAGVSGGTSLANPCKRPTQGLCKHSSYLYRLTPGARKRPWLRGRARDACWQFLRKHVIFACFPAVMNLGAGPAARRYRSAGLCWREDCEFRSNWHTPCESSVFVFTPTAKEYP